MADLFLAHICWLTSMSVVLFHLSSYFGTLTEGTTVSIQTFLFLWLQERAGQLAEISNGYVTSVYISLAKANHMSKLDNHSQAGKYTPLTGKHCKSRGKQWGYMIFSQINREQHMRNAVYQFCPLNTSESLKNKTKQKSKQPKRTLPSLLLTSSQLQTPFNSFASSTQRIA